jgi:hypothetical protein
MTFSFVVLGSWKRHPNVARINVEQSEKGGQKYLFFEEK